MRGLTDEQVTRKPPPKAAFLDAGSTVTVKVQLSHPLDDVGEQGPFQRVIFILPYADNDRCCVLWLAGG